MSQLVLVSSVGIVDALARHVKIALVAVLLRCLFPPSHLFMRELLALGYLPLDGLKVAQYGLDTKVVLVSMVAFMLILKLRILCSNCVRSLFNEF